MSETRTEGNHQEAEHRSSSSDSGQQQRDSGLGSKSSGDSKSSAAAQPSGKGDEVERQPSADRAAGKGAGAEGSSPARPNGRDSQLGAHATREEQVARTEIGGAKKEANGQPSAGTDKGRPGVTTDDIRQAVAGQNSALRIGADKLAATATEARDLDKKAAKGIGDAEAKVGGAAKSAYETLTGPAAHYKGDSTAVKVVGGIVSADHAVAGYGRDLAVGIGTKAALGPAGELYGIGKGIAGADQKVQEAKEANKNLTSAEIAEKGADKVLRALPISGDVMNVTDEALKTEQAYRAGDTQGAVDHGLQTAGRFAIGVAQVIGMEAAGRGSAAEAPKGAEAPKAAEVPKGAEAPTAAEAPNTPAPVDAAAPTERAPAPIDAAASKGPIYERVRGGPEVDAKGPVTERAPEATKAADAAAPTERAPSAAEAGAAKGPIYEQVRGGPEVGSKAAGEPLQEPANRAASETPTLAGLGPETPAAGPSTLRGLGPETPTTSVDPLGRTQEAPSPVAPLDTPGQRSPMAQSVDTPGQRSPMAQSVDTPGQRSGGDRLGGDASPRPGAAGPNGADRPSLGADAKGPVGTSGDNAPRAKGELSTEEFNRVVGEMRDLAEGGRQYEGPSDALEYTPEYQALRDKLAQSIDAGAARRQAGEFRPGER